MWGYFADFIANLREIPAYREMPVSDLLPTIFPNLHYIWLIRRDKVRQAVSLWKAIQTWRWKKNEPSTEQSPARELAFNFEAVDHLVQQITTFDAAWQHFFDENDIQPFTVVYEELTDTYEETALNILRYLNIPIPQHFKFAERQMKRQSNAISEEWIDQYHTISRERDS